MLSPRKYPQEWWERVIRLVQEARVQDSNLSLNQGVIQIGQRVGVNADTLLGWCKQAAIDGGERPGTTTTDPTRIKGLEAENRELKRANDIHLNPIRRTPHRRRRARLHRDRRRFLQRDGRIRSRSRHD